jgi:predicted permease
MTTQAVSTVDDRSPRWSAFVQDFRYAARGLRNTPGFTWAVVITLALGIGANVAMFSIVDRLLFRAPPMLRDAAHVHRVYLGQTFRGKEGFNSSIPYAQYVDLTNATHSFARTAVISSPDVAIGVGSDAREMPVGAVSASFFGFFDAPPALGRYFTAREDQPPTGTPVAVLSYGLWQTRYGGKRDVLGQTLQIGATLCTIIGVTPHGFVGVWSDKPPAVFIPITVRGSEMGASLRLRGEEWWTTYHWFWASMMAERKPGVTLAAANADLSRAYQQEYAAQAEKEPRMPSFALARPHAVVASILSDRGPDESQTARVATWISGVALIVWLIACANVANLLLARALRRRREIAVRLALGVNRGRLITHLLTESMVLALLAGAVGVVVAQLGGAVLRAVLLPKTATTSVVGDPRTLFIAGVAALAAGLLTGLAPITQLRHTNLSRDLKAGAREGTYHRSRLRVGLLVFQGALSVTLLVGAGLFVRSLHNVRNVPLGWDAEHLLAVELQMRDVKLDSAQKVTLRQRLLEEAAAIPGVEHAARQLTMPFWSMWNSDLHVAGIDSVRRLGQFYLNAVSPDYFAAMGTRILQGRGITEEDVDGAPGAMVVSQAMAKTLWPGKNAIGQCVKVGADTVPCTYVVGVAENIKQTSLSDEDAGLFYYLSAKQFHPDMGGLFVRMHGPAAASRETIRRHLQDAMPGASYVTVTAMSDVLGEETQSWHMGATMFAVFGLLALVLAAIGLYSVVAYNVAQRTHELGVRSALGAQMRDLAGLVVREALMLAAAGIVVGGAIALAAGRWLKPLLFEVSPHDPWIYVLVAAVLLAVAVVASFLPARRAAGVDPMQALRTE